MAITGSESIDLNLPSSGTVAKIANTVATTSSTVLNPNPNRVAFTVYNSIGQDVYIDFLPGVTSSSYAFMLPNGSLYECAAPYTGAVYAVAGSLPSGSLSVREFTP